MPRHSGIWGSGILQFAGVVALAAAGFLWWCFLCFFTGCAELSAALLLALALGVATALGVAVTLLAAMTGTAITPAASVARRIVLSFMSCVSVV
jgi:hypothetical protein